MFRKDDGEISMIDNIEIRKIIPHRYPFLLIDKVIEMEKGIRVLAIKNVTCNEPFFQGHFPQRPIMPGVLIVEALAQATGVCIGSLDENKGKLGVFTGIDSMKFRRQVVPGDILILKGEVVQNRMGLVKADVVATVDGQVAAEGTIKFLMLDADQA